ncbi:hypothetical protein ABC345_20800 [Shouchella sp. 1P09AA]|uniref:GHMP family kinase ATP-binding protein n=1 Tax=unclassified Shouchella TaxID=2893065 RepID=UPI0039A33BE5
MSKVEQLYIGNAIGHHGELIQGRLISHASEDTKKMSITLPWSEIGSTATLSVNNSYGGIICSSLSKEKALKAAKLTSMYLLGEELNGELTIYNSLAVGKGLGTSTMDVLAAIRAVSKSCFKKLEKWEEAELATKAELACDAVMFDDTTVLFSSEDATVLKDFNRKLPSMLIIGFDSEPKTIINTLDLRTPNYSNEELKIFNQLVDTVEKGIISNKLELIGEVATISADINQTYLPKKNYHKIKKIAENFKAIVGIQIAHTGTVMGLICDPDSFKNSLFEDIKLELNNIDVEPYLITIT